ncbi:MAG TPA: EAL domain-containing protein [Thermoanaerobaculia bacterium]|jgi:diguanylate cyclase (GGDEF)-like protein/PAS domain S-box-containing protein|nr:EAL domain-containing protein [Thermoanaerobaculia bacterium]
MRQALESPAEIPSRPTNDWFRTLAETTSTGIFVFRADRLVYVNPACEMLTGYSAEELLTRQPWDFAAPETQAALRDRALARLRGEPVPERYEVRIVTKDGRERWLDLTAALIELEEGQPATLATAVDVTERKLAEVALRESGARLELAQRVAGVITWEWDLITDEMVVSPHAAEVLGCRPDQLWKTGRELMAAVMPEDHPALVEALRNCLRGEKDFSIELRVLAPDGKPRWFSERGQALRDALGTPVRLIGAGHDISTRRLGEERLRAIVEGTATTTGTDFLRSLVRHLSVALDMEYAFVAEVVDEPATRARILAFWTGRDYGEPFEYELAGTPCETVHSREFCYYPAAAWRLFPGDRWLREEVIEAYLAVPLFDGNDRLLGHIAVMSTDPAGEDLAAVSILKIFAARAAAEIERHLAEEALAQQKELAQVTLASIGDGVIRTDAAGVVDYLNPVAERLTGWTAAEAGGQPVTRVFSVIDESTGKPLPNAVEHCLAEGRVIEHNGYSMLVRRDGREFAIRDSVAPIQDRQGRTTGSVLVFKDVTQLRGMEREMIYLARHDPLTGLINRREFEKRLQMCLDNAWQEAREHALFYLDLDEFKVVNDTCGHLAGDEMLKQVTALLKSLVRKSDALARLGGDEFGILLEDASLEDARELGERLRSAVRQYRFGWQERIFEIGVSIGLVPITAESGDMARVLSAADAACYVAKESGRNRMHEYQPDDSAMAERYGEMQWIYRIHKAFAEHRFCLYRQSIHPLHDDGSEPPLYEILIRMLDEEGRIASPAAFIPAAERYHLIASIDRWVVHAAFVALACGTLSHGDTTRFAINLSGQSVGDDAFLDYVLTEIEATGIAPERIFFEITETAAVGNLGKAMQFIRVLRELGFHFVLDDFGSGLSSFAYLKNLQVDFLKIDGTFVKDMTANSVQRALVESIHQIGQVMGIRTIAESVEDRTTLEALRDIGVNYAQGYGLSMPEPLI